MTIADKTILVTGANRGIGRALVAEALSRGPRGSTPAPASRCPTPIPASRR